MKTLFFLQIKLFSDIIAFVEKHKTIHTRFGMNDLFFLRPSFGQCAHRLNTLRERIRRRQK